MRIYKQRGSKNYTYQFKWTVKNANGTKETYNIRKSAKTTRYRTAEEVRDEHKHALRVGSIHPSENWPKSPPPKAPSVREFAPRFLEYANVKTKPGTARFYTDRLRRVLYFSPLANKLLDEVTTELVGKYIQWRRNQTSGNSIAAINGELRTLRRLFRLAEEWGEITKAPKIHEVPGQKGRERVLSDKEEAAYLRAASPTLRDAAILAVDTGLCPQSELFLLEWGQVRLEPGPEAPYGYVHVVGGKTDYRKRNVPLTPRARAVLEMRKECCGQGRYVFPGKGRSGHLMSLQHPHEQTIRKAGLEPFEIYCWRHTFGTRCAEAGMDKFSIARLMGHSSPSTAERNYVHVTGPHVMAGFERFLAARAARQIEAFPLETSSVQ